MTASSQPLDLRDVREGGRWTAAQTAKNAALWALASAALAVARRTPTSALARAGRALGRLAHGAWGSGRRVALDNLAATLPHLHDAARRELARRTFETLGLYLADAVAQLDGRSVLSPLVVEPEGLAILADARASGRGVLFASAHLGPWERVAAALVEAGIPLVTIAREPYDPRFLVLYERLRERRGVGVVYRGRPGAAARIVRTLRGGGVLGIPMDLRTRAPSAPAPFLGRLAPTPIGPARLALRTRARVVVGTWAEPGVVRVGTIETDDLDRAEAGAEAELTARINGELSRRVLEAPHAWPWMHERWKMLDESTP